MKLIKLIQKIKNSIQTSDDITPKQLKRIQDIVYKMNNRTTDDYAKEFIIKHGWINEDGSLFEYIINDELHLWVGEYVIKMEDVKLDIDFDLSKDKFFLWEKINKLLRKKIEYKYFVFKRYFF